VSLSLLTRGICHQQVQTVFQSVPIYHRDPRTFLVQTLKLPATNQVSEAKGIHQSEVIIRTALVRAIAHLRANEDLLNEVFASLPADEESADLYGEKLRSRAVEWFKATDVPIVMDYRGVQPGATQISISMVDSTEEAVTLADLHYEPVEAAQAAWEPLTDAFTPVTYSPVTGVMVVPDAIATALAIGTNMVVTDSTGTSHPIEEVVESNTIVIPSGTFANFRGARIKAVKPRLTRNLESLSFKETYRIGCHAHGEPYLLSWLHSIVTYCLLRWKQELLEARGFERSVIGSSAFARDDRWGQGENMWTRFINITGYVRQYWSKDVKDAVLTGTLDPALQISKVNGTSETFAAPPDQSDPEWIAQIDPAPEE
jgi:hypothetical protein